MANITKVSPYRSGAPRFGLKSQPFDNSVKISYLTPEELEEYRSGKRGGSKMFTYEDYQNRKAAGKSNQEIAKEMNVSEATLYNRIKVWKGQPLNSLPKTAQKAPNLAEKVSETNSITQDSKTEYQRIIEELKTKMESSSAAKDVIIDGLEKKVEHWRFIAEQNESQKIADFQAALNDSQEQLKETTLTNLTLGIKVNVLEEQLRDKEKQHQELQTKHNELLEDYYALKEEASPLRQLVLIHLRNKAGVLA